jgi:hypothetical protein
MQHKIETNMKTLDVKFILCYSIIIILEALMALSSRGGVRQTTRRHGIVAVGTVATVRCDP